MTQASSTHRLPTSGAVGSVSRDRITAAGWRIVLLALAPVGLWFYLRGRAATRIRAAEQPARSH